MANKDFSVRDNNFKRDKLSKRRKEILEAIILEHLKNAQAVGSKILSENYDFTVSSATIRNDMAELTKNGFIEQPHTSAGRVPTDKGYKFYINDIIDFEKNIPEQKIKMMQTLLSQNYQSIENMLSSILKFLANVSGQLSIIAEPDFSAGLLKKLDIFKIESNRLLIVISLDVGLDKTVIIQNSHNLSDAQIAAMVRYFNNQFAGLPIYQILLQFPKMLESEKLQKKSLFLKITSEITNAMNQASRYVMRFDGSVGFLNQPEFKSREKILQLLKIINKQDDFIEIFQKYKQDDYTILLGDEIRGENFADLVLIFGRYRVMGLNGFIGILGTKRMNYRENIPMICFASRMITEMTTKGTVMPYFDKEKLYV
ncbi:MAG: heat-inducible transcription repressor HrcA [Candidatus Cloacimonetes bacterium]|nr:heat-inducible transcription repressor HrcA [Candidatus Cloacimonadota bacterium]